MFQIVDLEPFTTYTFQVKAVNSIGQSKPSQKSYKTVTLRAGMVHSNFKSKCTHILVSGMIEEILKSKKRIK